MIVHAGYLVRTAQFENLSLHVTADFNSTTDIEIIGAPQARALYINDQPVRYSIDEHGVIAVTRTYTPPKLNLPDLSKLDWKYIDGLPEIRPDYDDTKWVSANRQSNNTYRNQTTPASLYSSDYGFHAGYLIYRGHFVSQGNEPSIRIQTQGGSAFGTSAWLNGTYLGSFTGVGGQTNYNSTFNLTNLIHGVPYVLTGIGRQQRL